MKIKLQGRNRTMDERSPVSDEFGHKPEFRCTCGHGFGESDLHSVTHHRATWDQPEEGSSYSPCCRTEDWSKNHERKFTVFSRRTTQLRNPAQKGIANEAAA